MARGCSLPSLTVMPWTADPDAEHLPHVYGAALASSADQAVAEEVSAVVISGAARKGGVPRRRLVAWAIQLAVRADPAPPFAPLPEREREALALARLGGLDVTEIAREMDCDERGAARLLRSALVALASGPMPGPQSAAVPA